MKSSTSPEPVLVCIVRAKISLNQRVPEFFINGCVRRKLSGNLLIAINMYNQNAPFCFLLSVKDC